MLRNSKLLCQDCSENIGREKNCVNTFTYLQECVLLWNMLSVLGVDLLEIIQLKNAGLSETRKYDFLVT